MQTDISGATAKGSGDDTCVLPYSSGTTGLPKGTMLTHETIAANLHQVRPAVMLEEVQIASNPIIVALTIFLIAIRIDALPVY